MDVMQVDPVALLSDEKSLIKTILALWTVKLGGGQAWFCFLPTCIARVEGSRNRNVARPYPS